MSLAAYYAHLDTVLAPARARKLVIFSEGPVSPNGWSIGTGLGRWLVRGAATPEEAVEQACAAYDALLADA